MTKKLSIILLAVLVGAQAGAAKIKIKPLRDGFSLDGVDGEVVQKANNWFFVPLETLTDDEGIVKAGSKLEFLPSSGLERLIQQKTSAGGKSFRIWGTVTQFENKNFIFAAYSLPITEANEAPPRLENVKMTGPNEPNVIPEDVMEILRPRRVVNLAKLKKGPGSKQDSITAGRTGFLQENKDGFIFAFDAIGRNVDTTSFPLLKCSLVERMRDATEKSPEKLRYKMVGIITKYQGKYYLLPQWVTRQYSNGNFRR